MAARKRRLVRMDIAHPEGARMPAVLWDMTSMWLTVRELCSLVHHLCRDTRAIGSWKEIAKRDLSRAFITLRQLSEAGASMEAYRLTIRHVLPAAFNKRAGDPSRWYPHTVNKIQLGLPFDPDWDGTTTTIVNHIRVSRRWQQHVTETRTGTVAYWYRKPSGKLFAHAYTCPVFDRSLAHIRFKQQQQHVYRINQDVCVLVDLHLRGDGDLVCSLSYQVQWAVYRLRSKQEPM